MLSLGLLEAYDIDDNNTVYGSGSRGGVVWPARWVYDATSASWAAPEFFATLVPTPQSTFALATNAVGQATGRADDAALAIHIALWQTPSVLVDVGMCPGYTYGRGDDINASGQITGTCRRTVGSTSEFDGFVWTPTTPNGSTGTFTMLPRYSNSIRNFPAAINDQGEVVGYSQDAKGNSTALLWRPGVSGYSAAVDLNAGAAISASATDINNASVAVGKRLITSRGHSAAFIWDAQGGARNLPTPGKIDAGAVAITQSLPYRIAGTTSDGAVRWLVP